MKRSAFLALLIGSILWAAWGLASQTAPAIQAAGLAATVESSDPTTDVPGATEIDGWQAKVEPALLKRLLGGKPGAQYRVVVELAAQAQIEGLGPAESRTERRNRVVGELQSTAAEAQRGLLTYLESQQEGDQVERIQPFWVLNGVGLTADGDTLLAVARRPEVRLIREDRWQRWVEPFSPVESGGQALANDVEWNIAQIRADEAWAALGLDGSGVTVAIMDTGVDWQHPALQLQYRGYKPGGLTNHYGNWFCTTDEGYIYPFDGYGHGTHVAGTAVGGRDGAGTAIGVAPGAKWIAVKTLNDGGFGYDSWIHAAFQWLLAPAGNPSLAPDIVNGSWGASNPLDPVFRPDVQALRAAGIVPVFAAGNEGPDPASLRLPASYPETLAVGATDDLDQVAYFSSRGPSPWGEVKPEVAAPGAQIRSTLPGGTYGVAGGTSMATPHVSGLAAILLQADPNLTPGEIEDLLTTTAAPLGDEVPNNDTGWGRVDAYQAAAVAVEAGFVAGQIRRQPDLEPLSIAQITAYDDMGQERARIQADDDGRYRLALLPGQFDLAVEAFGYARTTVPGVMVQTGVTVTVDLALSPLPTGVVWGQVTNAETGGPVGARLAVPGTPAYAQSDPNTGQYSLALPAGSYVLEAVQNGYQRQALPPFDLAADQALRLDLALNPRPTLLLVDGGHWYYDSQAGYFEQALDDNDWVYDLWDIREPSTDLPTLTPYELVIWSSPQDSPGLIGAGDIVSDYLGLGGSLFVTGQDVGFWDGGLSGITWHQYYGQFLKAMAVEDNAGRENVEGVAGELLHGLSLPINGPDSAGNQSTPDLVSLIDARDGAVVARYGSVDAAALRASSCQSYRSVYLAAGFEGLGDRAGRAAAMDGILSWLAAPPPVVGVELYPAHDEQVWLGSDEIDYTVELRNLGQARDRFTLELSASNWPTSVWDESLTQPLIQTPELGSCERLTLTVRVTVPVDVAW
ncbi:MAG: S8 family serine peptidase, partial [Anaerolineae bacterium]